MAQADIPEMLIPYQREIFTGNWIDQNQDTA